MLSVHVLQVQAGQNTPLQAFAGQQRVSLQLKVLLAMGMLEGGFGSDYSSGKSEGLSMFSVGHGLLWGFFPTICLIPVVAQPPVTFYWELSKDVLAAVLAVPELSRVGPPPLQVFVGARLAGTSVLHRDVSAVILEVSAPALCLDLDQLCCQTVPRQEHPWAPGGAHFPKFHAWIVAASSRRLVRQQQQGLAALLPWQIPSGSGMSKRGFTPLLIGLVNETACWRTKN